MAQRERRLGLRPDDAEGGQTTHAGVCTSNLDTERVNVTNQSPVPDTPQSLSRPTVQHCTSPTPTAPHSPRHAPPPLSYDAPPPSISAGYWLWGCAVGESCNLHWARVGQMDVGHIGPNGPTTPDNLRATCHPVVPTRVGVNRAARSSWWPGVPHRNVRGEGGAATSRPQPPCRDPGYRSGPRPSFTAPRRGRLRVTAPLLARATA